MLDIAQLSQLPLTVLVIVGAYWVIQRINDQHANQIVALTKGFLEQYKGIIDRAAEEREEARQRWVERDKLLINTLVDNQRVLVENTKENHNLRSALTPLLTRFELDRRRAESGRAAQDGGNRGATD